MVRHVHFASLKTRGATAVEDAEALLLFLKDAGKDPDESSLPPLGGGERCGGCCGSPLQSPKTSESEPAHLAWMEWDSKR